jgi:hypothetical protein
MDSQGIVSLAELLPHLIGFRTVIVTGPQRSGTTIATEIIAAELGVEAIREETFREDNLLRFASCVAAPRRAIIQAPALSSIVHLIKQRDIAVVFMFRDIEAIIRSEGRICWTSKYECYEKAKYLRSSDQRPIAEIKYAMWKETQCAMLGRRAFTLAYDSLQSHKLWVPPDRRTRFGPRQTRDDEPMDAENQ